MASNAHTQASTARPRALSDGPSTRALTFTIWKEDEAIIRAVREMVPRIEPTISHARWDAVVQRAWTLLWERGVKVTWSLSTLATRLRFHALFALYLEERSRGNRRWPPRERRLREDLDAIFVANATTHSTSGEPSPTTLVGADEDSFLESVARANTTCAVAARVDATSVVDDASASARPKRGNAKLSEQSSKDAMQDRVELLRTVAAVEATRAPVIGWADSDWTDVAAAVTVATGRTHSTKICRARFRWLLAAFERQDTTWENLELCELLVAAAERKREATPATPDASRVPKVRTTTTSQWLRGIATETTTKAAKAVPVKAKPTEAIRATKATKPTEPTRAIEPTKATKPMETTRAIEPTKATKQRDEASERAGKLAIEASLTILERAAKPRQATQAKRAKKARPDVAATGCRCHPSGLRPPGKSTEANSTEVTAATSAVEATKVMKAAHPAAVARARASTKAKVTVVATEASKPTDKSVNAAIATVVSNISVAGQSMEAPKDTNSTAIEDASAKDAAMATTATETATVTADVTTITPTPVPVETASTLITSTIPPTDTEATETVTALEGTRGVPEEASAPAGGMEEEEETEEEEEDDQQEQEAAMFRILDYVLAIHHARAEDAREERALKRQRLGFQQQQLIDRLQDLHAE